MTSTQINYWPKLSFIAWPAILALMLWNCQAGEPPSMTNAVTAASILKNLSYQQAVSAHLLAFTSREDNRPWYVDDALLVLNLSNKQWVLVHAVRNPQYPQGHRGGSTNWNVHVVMDAPFVGDRHYDHRPTREEMDRFLKDNEWQFETDKYWRVVSREVNEETWQKVLGYKSSFSSVPQKPAKPDH